MIQIVCGYLNAFWHACTSGCENDVKNIFSLYPEALINRFFPFLNYRNGIFQRNSIAEIRGGIFQSEDQRRLRGFDGTFNTTVGNGNVQRTVSPSWFYSREKADDHIDIFMTIHSNWSFIVFALVLDVICETSGIIIQLFIGKKAVLIADGYILPMILGIKR